MEFELIKNGVAAQINNFNIKDISVDKGIEIKNCLLENVVVVLKNQDVAPAYFTNFVDNIGPIANHDQFIYDPITGERKYSLGGKNDKLIDPLSWPDPYTYPVQRVTGKKVKGEISGIFGTGILDWHANLNGLTRADGVALQGIKDVEGTSTSFLNTAKVYEEMPEELIERCNNVYCEYEYSPDTWAAGLPEKQKAVMMKNQSHYKMWLIQENILGKKGIYFYTNNRCNIITEDKKLYQDLYDFVFQEKYIYSHTYEVGDIVLSDQLLSLHKRDQNDPGILSKRTLHRITFRLSNTGNPTWIERKNSI